MVGGSEPSRNAPDVKDRSGEAADAGDLIVRLERSRAWGRLQVVRELNGGFRNHVVLVEREGRPLVAKSSRRSPAALAWLADVHRHARSAGIDAPELVPTLDGRLVDDGITVERFVAGRPADARGMARLRSRLRAFHDATRSVPQRPGFTSCTDLLHGDTGGDVDLRAMPDEVVRACRAAWARLGDSLASVVHGDLNPSNILETDEGGIALLDWDEARVDVSLLDEVALSLSLGARPRPGWEPAEVALKAWEVAAGWRLEPAYARRMAAHLPPAPADGT